MEALQRDSYYKGYIAGYRDGMADASNGKSIHMLEQDLTMLPIEALNLSARAFNCLTRAGCKYISDVVMLSSHKIATMRNLGPKSASEIAHSLDTQGIRYTNWCIYL